ncbi:MAG: hypothetical protein QM768_03625 [Agriterribacter sp.]
MKKNLLLLLCLSIFFTSSCKKDDTTNTPTKSVEELLTAETWKVDELRLNNGDNPTQYYYKRGGLANTDNRDSDSLKFNTDKTGLYYYQGVQYTTNWEFTNSDKSRLTLIVNYTVPETVYWENINVSDDYLRYAQYSLSTSKNYVATVTRIPN